MIIECCSQERTFSKFYSQMGERFCALNRNWQETFEQAFDSYYTTIHRYETNRLRNIAKFFAYLISHDAIGWHVFSVIRLTEEDTTSSSRIFIKIMFQDLQEQLGLKTLVERLKDSYLQDSFEGIFPRMNPKDIRFSINYFTSIGLGAVTEDMRAALQNMPKPVQPAIKNEESDSESISSSERSRSSYSSASYSSSGSASDSGSDSRDDRGRSRSMSGRPPRRRHTYSSDESVSSSSRRSYSRRRTETPPRRDYSPRSKSRRPRYEDSASSDESPPPRTLESARRQNASPARHNRSPRDNRSGRRFHDSERPDESPNVSPRHRQSSSRRQDDMPLRHNRSPREKYSRRRYEDEDTLPDTRAQRNRSPAGNNDYPRSSRNRSPPGNRQSRRD